MTARSQNLNRKYDLSRFVIFGDDLPARRSGGVKTRFFEKNEFLFKDNTLVFDWFQTMNFSQFHGMK
jgi:hypothetical protein